MTGNGNKRVEADEYRSRVLETIRRWPGLTRCENKNVIRFRGLCRAGDAWFCMAQDSRTARVPERLRRMTAEVVDRRGVGGACKALGLGRTALLAVLADLPVTSGTRAVLTLAEQRREQYGSPVELTGLDLGGLPHEL